MLLMLRLFKSFKRTRMHVLCYIYLPIEPTVDHDRSRTRKDYFNQNI